MRRRKALQQSLEEHLAERAKRKAEFDAKDEDTPEKIEWFKQGVKKRRAEFGWIFKDE